jgi:tRNA threonylcarbamoyladenosine biosynthesis protein TsaB
VIVLALDTSTARGSCAVAGRDDRVVEQAGDSARSHVIRLPGELMALLESAHLSLDEIEAYAVATGPGSFTGLRVGIATMQGLAFAAGKPLVGVSAFDALAVLAGAAAAGGADSGVVATWIDAWRGEVYAAVYEDGQPIEPPSVEPPRAILERLRGRRLSFIGDGAATHAAEIVAALGTRATLCAPAAPLLAGTIARLAVGALRGGHRPPPHAIRPLYVRRPDAELARSAGTGR